MRDGEGNHARGVRPPLRVRIERTLALPPRARGPRAHTNKEKPTTSSPRRLCAVLAFLLYVLVDYCGRHHAALWLLLAAAPAGGGVVPPPAVGVRSLLAAAVLCTCVPGQAAS